MRRIVTVTLNPAIDRTVWVDALVPGTTVRTADTRASFGGKGINVARGVARIGAPVTALGLAGEDQATTIERHLESLGVAANFIRTPGETRTNLKIIEQVTGRLTEINGSGAQVSSEQIERARARAPLRGRPGRCRSRRLRGQSANGCGRIGLCTLDGNPARRAAKPSSPRRRQR